MSSLLRKALPVAIAAATVLSAGWGARATLRGKPWYRTLRKSRLTPPDAAFGPVWTALYALEAVSAIRIGRAASSPERSRALALWAAQQGLNAAWSPLFFGQRRARTALADIALLGATLEGYRRAARRVDRVAAGLVVPYLAWVGFAAFLNAQIVRQNPRLLRA
jgi:tryptophan-rich sensory protein